MVWCGGVQTGDEITHNTAGGLLDGWMTCDSSNNTSPTNLAAG